MEKNKTKIEDKVGVMDRILCLFGLHDFEKEYFEELKQISNQTGNVTAHLYLRRCKICRKLKIERIKARC